MSEVLSSLCLNFNEYELQDVYRKEKVAFYSKAMPVLCVMTLLMSGTFQFYIGFEAADLQKNMIISVVNGAVVLVVLLITCLHKKFPSLHYLVCPLLTLLLFTYLSFFDYDYTLGSIYYSLIIGFTLTYFILIIFNERWLLSTTAFAPGLTWYMYKTGIDLLGEEWQELIMRSVFCSLVYAVVAYKIEALTK